MVASILELQLGGRKLNLLMDPLTYLLGFIYLFIYYNLKVFVMCNLSLGCCLASLYYGGWLIFHLATHS
jgi:hypothetical protein